MASSKSELRRHAKARRAVLAKEQPDFPQQLAGHAAALNIPDASLIGAYAALPGEADPHLLLEHLVQRGSALAFPRVVAAGEPLEFHHWKPGRELQSGRFGIREPAPDWPIAFPCILLVPLLAFDAKGNRLGYGGGYYDRTFAALQEPLRVIGVCYAGQEVDAVPNEPHDRPLEMVITENGVRRFG